MVNKPKAQKRGVPTTGKSQTKVNILVGLCRNLAQKRFGDADRWDKIGMDDAVSRYFPGGDPALTSYTQELDGVQPFATDQIVFAPHEFAGAQKVADLFDDIVGRYRKSGFTVS